MTGPATARIPERRWVVVLAVVCVVAVGAAVFALANRTYPPPTPGLVEGLFNEEYPQTDISAGTPVPVYAFKTSRGREGLFDRVGAHPIGYVVPATIDSSAPANVYVERTVWGGWRMTPHWDVDPAYDVRATQRVLAGILGESAQQRVCTNLGYSYLVVGRNPSGKEAGVFTGDPENRMSGGSMVVYGIQDVREFLRRK